MIAKFLINQSHSVAHYRGKLISVFGIRLPRSAI